MNRLSKWVAHLYPRWWRERYGEEFAALLEDSQPGIKGVFDIARGAMKMQLTTWSATRVIMACAVLGLLVVWGRMSTRAPQYEAKATLSIATSGTPVVDVVNSLSQEALSRPALATIMREFDLYKEERNSRPLEDVVEIMRRNIRVNPEEAPTGKTALFNITFAYPDARLAREVDTKLVSAYIDANVRPRQGATPAILELRTVAFDQQSPQGWWKLGFLGFSGGMMVGGIVALAMRLMRKAA